MWFFNIFFQPFIADLANAVKTFSDEEFIVEAVGILGNIVVPGLDYAQLLTNYDMLSYIKSKLQPGKAKVRLLEDEHSTQGFNFVRET